MLKRIFSVQNSFLALLSTLFFLILNGVVQAAPSTTTTPPAPGVPAGTPASSILFNAVPDPMKWLNEFEARVNNTGITNGAVHLAGAFILAVVTYKIIRALMEKNNAKMFVALVYCVISTVALNLSKPNNG